jgi:hypothetical protein
MKYNSALLTEGRNKLGDTVWARNPSGNYIRARVKPTNPNTILQQYTRTFFSQYTKAFRTLTAAQIKGWNALGASINDHDKLGQVIHPSGLQLFMRCNMNLAYFGIGQISDPPSDSSIPAAPAMTETSVTGDGGGYVQIQFTTPGITTASTIYAFPYVTAGFSSGVTFVAPFLYKIAESTSRTPDTGENYINLGTGYPQPAPAPGQKVAWGYRAINTETGFASKLISNTALYTG